MPILTMIEAKQRKAEVKVSLDSAETKLKLLKLKLDNSKKNSKKMTDIEHMNIIIDKFREQMAKENLTDTEKNDQYKLIISHIVWDGTDDTYVIDLNFL